MNKIMFLLCIFQSILSAKSLDNVPLDVKVTKDVILLKNEQYNSYFSKKYKIPLITVEFIEESDFKGQEKRKNRFLIDRRVKISEQANNHDYYKTNYDKGHLVAAANSTTKYSILEQFFFTNIAPQNPLLNRTTWKSIESYSRKVGGYVITGVGFDNCDIYETLSRGIAVPDYFWKIIIPENNSVRIFMAKNIAPTKRIYDYVSSITEIKQKLCGVKIDLDE